MEKIELRKVLYSSSLIIYFLILFSVICVGVDFLWSTSVSIDRWVEYFSGPEIVENRGNNEDEFMKYHLGRLVRGEDKKKLDEIGFACDRDAHSIVCVSNKPVMIDTDNMTVFISSDQFSGEETVVRPYARQEDELKAITPVHMVLLRNDTNPPACEFNHRVPAVVFSSGSIGNIFHEMNEIIIPLYITTRQFQSQIQFILKDYNPRFISKFGKILHRLSDYDVINPSEKQGILCFPGAIVGLKYHDNLALNSSKIPGGYSMTEFRRFLWQAYDLKFNHVSQIQRPRLMLLSRTNTRRFLNEEELISTIQQLGFEVIVIKRSRSISNLNKFSQLINSCKILLGAHGAGLTNEIFLPDGAVMIQVELLGTEWASNTYYGDTARAMHVHYLKYKIDPEESSLVKLYGRDHPVVVDPGSVFEIGGYRASRAVFLDQQNVRVNLTRFRNTLVEALSIVSN